MLLSEYEVYGVESPFGNLNFFTNSNATRGVASRNSSIPSPIYDARPRSAGDPLSGWATSTMRTKFLWSAPVAVKKTFPEYTPSPETALCVPCRGCSIAS